MGLTTSERRSLAFFTQWRFNSIQRREITIKNETYSLPSTSGVDAGISRASSVSGGESNDVRCRRLRQANVSIVIITTLTDGRRPGPGCDTTRSVTMTVN